MKNIIFYITLALVINLAQNSTHYYKQMYLPLFFRSPMPVHQWCSVTGQYTAASSEQSHQMSWWCQQWLPSWTPTGGDKCQCSQRRNHSFLRFVSVARIRIILLTLVNNNYYCLWIHTWIHTRERERELSMDMHTNTQDEYCSHFSCSLQ